jgi:anti-sigma regulatory factor (Ser/Thr protein kinase)
MAETGTELPAYAETLPRTPESVGDARRLVDQALSVWDMKDAQDSAVLVVSELLTNAVQHARRASVGFSVMRLSETQVRVAVVDLSHVQPHRRSAGAIEEDGRGLGIVDVLTCGRWGVDLLPWGKRVWAEVSTCPN